MQPIASEQDASARQENLSLLERWNDTRTDYAAKCIHQLFEEQAERTPSATALVCRDQAMTYRDLNKKANQLAHYLKRLGVRPGRVVGICMHRSIEMIVGILATLKAGGAYVPLDPSYPKKRLSTMFDEIDMTVLLSRRDLLDSLPPRAAKTVCLDTEWRSLGLESTENMPPSASFDDLAYVIFTSGSTGKPKAAAVYHRGWTNLMTWFVSQFEIQAADKVLVVSSFSFDITQRSIVMPLIVGGELHLLGTVAYDPTLVRRIIRDKAISLLNCAPSMFYLLIEDGSAASYEALRPIRILFLGGEPISASRMRDWAQSEGCATAVVNVYGIAECSDVSSYYELVDYERYAESSVPIGRPIHNTQIYLLDEDLRPVPFGAAGEVCIAGDGIGKGYVNDPALTAAKFVENPFDAGGGKLYRTGDLGRLRPDLILEFVGRVDHQVKLHGLRIDLGDIEAALRQHPAVREAVVVSQEDASGDQRLVAYVVTKQRLAEQDLGPELRSFLRQTLPRYMVPTDFAALEQMPLSPNGKIDRKALASRGRPVS